MFTKRFLTRRQTLWLGLASLAGLSTSLTGNGKILSQQLPLSGEDQQKAKSKVPTTTYLKQAAAARGLFYGAAANQYCLSQDPSMAIKFAQECAMLVPENEMKWEYLSPSPGQYDFSKSDWLVEFALQKGIRLRGHTLVWNQSLPSWFNTTVNAQNAKDYLVKHVHTVVNRYAGRIHSWDVVNEAIWPEDGQVEGLRRSPWLNLLGPDYIDIAFRAAREADPRAMLVYNGDRLDHDTPDDEARRVATLKLLKKLKSRGVPIQALGIQAHVYGYKPFNAQKMRDFLREVAKLGLKIIITEMDIIDDQLPNDIKTRDQLVASAYQSYLSTVLAEPAVIGVLTWGLSDRYTWLAKYGARPDGAPVRPLPLDANLNRKLAWNAISNAFSKAPKR